MNNAVQMMAMLLGAAAMLAGCSGGGGAAKTPKEAVANFSRSIEKADKALFLSTVNMGADDKELAGAMFDVMAVMVGISNDMDKAYGKEAGADLKKGAPIFSAEELAKLEIKEEGDKATVKDPKDKGGKPLDLIKKDGVWLVDMTKQSPPAAERKKMIEQSQAMVKALGEVRAKIGKPGTTKESIGMEFLGAMMKVGMAGETGTMPTP
jgi:hypothetical protein